METIQEYQARLDRMENTILQRVADNADVYMSEWYANYYRKRSAKNILNQFNEDWKVYTGDISKNSDEYFETERSLVASIEALSGEKCGEFAIKECEILYHRLSRDNEFQKIKKHIEAFCGSEKDAIKILEHTKKALKIENNFICAIKMVDYGEFEVYFEDAKKLLKELYGEEYVEKIYKTKKGDFRVKNGEVYLWTIYKNKIAQTFVKMMKEEK